jgi:hypothetical protein
MSRIWDLPCSELDTAGLVAEHRELHGVWTVITQRQRGDANHPETLRWRNHLRALYRRHEEQVHELERRGLVSGPEHSSELDPNLIPDYDDGSPPLVLLPLEEQRALLAERQAWRRRPDTVRTEGEEEPAPDTADLEPLRAARTS